MRAIADLELVTPKQLHDSMTMINLLGTRNGAFNEQTVFNEVNDKQAGITLYRKHESRVKRKMGHINIWGENQKQRAEQLVRTLEV